jgi:hypothetical protein
VSGHCRTAGNEAHGVATYLPTWARSWNRPCGGRGDIRCHADVKIKQGGVEESSTAALWWVLAIQGRRFPRSQAYLGRSGLHDKKVAVVVGPKSEGQKDRVRLVDTKPPSALPHRQRRRSEAALFDARAPNQDALALKTAASGPDKDADRGRSLGSAVALDARIAASARPQSRCKPGPLLLLTAGLE